MINSIQQICFINAVKNVVKFPLLIASRRETIMKVHLGRVSLGIAARFRGNRRVSRATSSFPSFVRATCRRLRRNPRVKTQSRHAGMHGASARWRAKRTRVVRESGLRFRVNPSRISRCRLRWTGQVSFGRGTSSEFVARSLIMERHGLRFNGWLMNAGRSSSNLLSSIEGREGGRERGGRWTSGRESEREEKEDEEEEKKRNEQ